MVAGWKYYNNALIPDCAPHESPDVSQICSPEFWECKSGTPLFARWTDEFESEEYKDFWYCICKSPFTVDNLPAKARKHIRQAMKKCTVERIDIEKNIEALYKVFIEACENYKQFKGNTQYEQFKNRCLGDAYAGNQYWVGKNDEGLIIGYLIVKENKDYAETVTAKFWPEYLHLRVSDALYATILDEYLNNRNKRYISFGTRTLSHITNTQVYKEKTFGCEKAYVRLNIEYNPKIRPVIKILYIFKGFLKLFDKIEIVHKINAVLKMEEIVRKQKG